MTLKDLIMQTSFGKVSPEARKVFHLFGHIYQKETDTLHRVFDMLKDIEPNPIQSGWANDSFPKGSKMILNVIHGDVSGFVDEASLERMTEKDRENWSYACGLGVLPLNQWLGAEVESDLSPEAIVANFLYEVRCRLSDDEDILKVLTQGSQTEDDGKKQFKYENGVVTFYEGTTYISEYDLGNDQCVKEVKTVILPDSITYIDYKAFVKCDNLTNVIVNGNVTCVGGTLDETPWYKNQPDGLVYVGNVLYGYKGEMPMGTNIVLKEGTSGIANDAFQDCRGLTSIVIPNSVTKVGEFAFRDCKGLTSIVIPNSVTKIGEFAFTGCSQLKSITLPSSLNVMEKGLFFGCSKLVSIVFPKTDFVIENRVFEGCDNLTHIRIPRNVKEIIPGQFYDCSTIAVDKRNPVYDSREDCNAIIETATNILVAGCKTTIIPKTVKEIGDKAFSGCSELRSVNIPRSVSHIGLLAFSSCSGLTSIEIPNTVKKIENCAFEFCSNLKTVVIKGTDTMIMPGAFDYDALPSIFVPAGSEEWYKSQLPEELHDKIKTAMRVNPGA